MFCHRLKMYTLVLSLALSPLMIDIRCYVWNRHKRHYCNAFYALDIAFLKLCMQSTPSRKTMYSFLGSVPAELHLQPRAWCTRSSVLLLPVVHSHLNVSGGVHGDIYRIFCIFPHSISWWHHDRHTFFLIQALCKRSYLYATRRYLRIINVHDYSFHL